MQYVLITNFQLRAEGQQIDREPVSGPRDLLRGSAVSIITLTTPNYLLQLDN